MGHMCRKENVLHCLAAPETALRIADTRASNVGRNPFIAPLKQDMPFHT
jgi:hypothetical protein